MIIRNLEERDLDEVTALEESCFSTPWRRQDFEDVLNNPDRIYLVAEEENEILGGIMLSMITSVHEGDISNVEVWEKHRCKHVGSKLLDEILRVGQEEYDIREFTLEVREKNMAARKLYENAGFISEGIRPNFYDNPKDNAVIMWKR